MKNLYYSIEINKVLEDTKDVRKYYITKDNGYGFEITKSNNGIVEEDVAMMSNISDNENDVKMIIDELIKYDDNQEQINYIVTDYLENFKKQVTA